MVLIGLLVVAVVSLILGLALTSTVWLVVSLVASVVAAVVLVLLVRAQRRTAKSPATSDATGAGTDQPRTDQPRGQQEPPPAHAAEGDFDGRSDALVVDGQPLYHRAGCADLETEHAEKIPLAQAIEDGFAPCSTCKPVTDVPQAGSAGASGPGQPASAHDGAPLQVWVIDGRPDYHLAGCSQLADGDGEVVPRAQAVEDGFQPCSACRPDELTASTTTEPSQDAAARDATPETVESPAEREMALVGAGAATSATTMTMPVSGSAGVGGGEDDGRDAAAGAVLTEVWVADGYPEYHVEACGELRGLSAEAVPYDQAVEDGFQPCVVCNPDAVAAGRPPVVMRAASDDSDDVAEVADANDADAGDARSAEVWVVDGMPDYHRDSCARLPAQGAERIAHSQAVEDGFHACDVCTPDSATPPTADPPAAGSSEPTAVSGTPSSEASADVWVVDGFPDYHRRECPQTLGLDVEPVPHDQAVEDGFAACTTCRPEDEHAPDLNPVQVPTGAASAAGQDATPHDTSGVPEQVWVVDGYPDFHRTGCPRTEHHSAEQIPGEQAIEDGFAACSVCAPLAADAPDFAASTDDDVATAAAADAGPQVWVADGFPAYHRSGCRVLAGLDDESVPQEQAVEDGFHACDVCRPEDDTAPDGYDRPEAAVVDADTPAGTEATAADTDTDTDTGTAGADAGAAEAEAEVARVAEVKRAEGERAEQAERERAEQAERERAEQAERERAEQAERESAEQAERERAEQAERESAEQAERERAEQAERERAEQAERERAEQAERERAEQAERAAAAEATATAPEAPAAPEPEPEPEPEPQPQPQPAAVSTSGAASGSAHRVWVLDGRPRYHAQDCLIIKGQQAEPLPLEDAVEQGFAPCSLCSRS